GAVARQLGRVFCHSSSPTVVDSRTIVWGMAVDLGDRLAVAGHLSVGGVDLSRATEGVRSIRDGERRCKSAESPAKHHAAGVESCQPTKNYRSLPSLSSSRPAAKGFLQN